MNTAPPASRISLHIAVRRHKLWRKPININSIYRFYANALDDSLYLNEIRKNLAANLERSPLTRSIGYGSAGDRSTLFAISSLSFVPFMQYAGQEK